MAVNEKNDNIELNIIIIGKFSVGKRSMTYRFLGIPLEEDMPIMQCGPAVTDISIEGVKYTLKIHENHPDYCDDFLTWINDTMLIYEIDDKASFEDIKKCYIKKIKNLKNKTCILIGNKLDLESKRQVTKKEAEEFANENEILFMEVSAKDNMNVKEAFMKIAHEAVKKRQEILSKENSNFFNKCHKCLLI